MATKEIEFDVIAEKKPNGSEALEVISPTPLSLMEQAIAKGVSVEQLQVIQQMYYAQQDRDAKRAFDLAMLEFKKNPPVIRKTRPVKYKANEVAYYYAPLEEVCPLVIAELNRHGITHKWRTDPPVNPGWVRVTCILTHELGHKEENGLEAPLDTSGGKNPIQSVISTTHYLERVTLLSACGLAAAGMDTDGLVTNGWLADAIKQLSECVGQQHLQKLFTDSYNQAKKEKNGNAIMALVEARDKRRAELG